MWQFLKTDTNTEEKGNGKIKLLFILAGGALGVLLLLFGSGAFGTASKTTEKTEIYSAEEDELIIYQRYIESRVKNLCESVHGIQNVTAVVTLSGGFSSVYATEMQDGNEEYVIIGSGSSASALFMSRSAPDIIGIGIVCDGGGSITVQKELTDLLCAAFHISSNRVHITGSNG